MATKKSAGFQTVYQLKITLKGIRPPIWRTMLYPQVLKPLHRVYLGDKSFMARTGELELLG